jgi:hypothetical protein
MPFGLCSEHWMHLFGLTSKITVEEMPKDQICCKPWKKEELVVHNT